MLAREEDPTPVRRPRRTTPDPGQLGERFPAAHAPRSAPIDARDPNLVPNGEGKLRAVGRPGRSVSAGHKPRRASPVNPDNERRAVLGKGDQPSVGRPLRVNSAPREAPRSSSAHRDGGEVAGGVHIRQAPSVRGPTERDPGVRAAHRRDAAGLCAAGTNDPELEIGATYAIHPPAGDQTGCTSEDLSARTSSLSSDPSTRTVIRRLPPRKTTQRPSGDQPGCVPRARRRAPRPSALETHTAGPPGPLRTNAIRFPLRESATPAARLVPLTSNRCSPPRTDAERICAPASDGAYLGRRSSRRSTARARRKRSRRQPRLARARMHPSEHAASRHHRQETGSAQAGLHAWPFQVGRGAPEEVRRRTSDSSRRQLVHAAPPVCALVTLARTLACRPVSSEGVPATLTDR